MHMITIIYKTVNGFREGRFSCPVVVPGVGRGRWIMFTPLKIYSVCLKACFSSGHSVTLNLWLTFVMLSLRVQPSPWTASPLRTRPCIPITVSFHGLLLQQAPPFLLLPHGWWASVCIPPGIFMPLRWIQLSCFGYVNVSTTTTECVKRHDSCRERHRMWKGYKIPWVSLSIASWDFWPFVYLTFT